MNRKILAMHLKGLVDNLEGTESDQKTCELLMTVANSLLKAVSEEKEFIQEMDDNGERRIFGPMGSIGEIVCSFYGNYDKELEGQTEALRQQLSNTTSAISKIKEQKQVTQNLTESLRQEEAILLGREQELTLKEKEREALVAKIEHLKTLEQNNAPETIEQLENDRDNLQRSVDEFGTKKKSLDDILQGLKKRHDVELEVNQIVGYFRGFSEEFYKVKEAHTYYQKYEKENSEVLKKIKESGFGTSEGLSKADELHAACKKILGEYDGILSKYLNDAKDIKKTIEKRQDPAYKA
ncbi:hypothetical protein FACS1894216_13550 [Synergistales bacterium]|nr:hypothetical protein FACS1894216_13550 [Synergistales bacterium]